MAVDLVLLESATVEEDLLPWLSKDSDVFMQGGWKTGFVRNHDLLLEYKIHVMPGKPWMLFLHGYGQDFRAFEPVYDCLGSDFSFLSIHLPLHGESNLESDGILTKEAWAACLELLLRQLETGSLQAVAFSMGAKFLLAAAELKPELFSQIILLAPDGLAMNPWYRLATGTRAGRQVLRLLLWLFPAFRLMVSLLAFSGLVRPALMRFALAELGTRAGRLKVQKVWLLFRKLWPDPELLRAVCQQNNLPVFVFLGRHDGILPLARFARIQNRFAWMKWAVLKTGHAGLIDKYAEILRSKK